jgi:hypothetical protein
MSFVLVAIWVELEIVMPELLLANQIGREPIILIAIGKAVIPV